MFKIIAVDIDGTLLNSQKEITENTLNTLLAVQQKGVKLIIATGRSPYGVRMIAEQLQLARFGGYITGCNGAVAVNAQDIEKPLYNEKFPLECLPDICKIIKDREVGISTYEGNSIVVGNCLTKYILRNAQMLAMPYKFVGDFPAYVTFPVNKCLLSGEPEEIAELEGTISKRFEGTVSAFRSEAFLLEMVRAGVNKGAALKFIAESLGVQRKECMAFGDNDNDIPMIKYAGTGVAMENAVTGAKSVADIIAPSNDNDGVAEIIKKIV